MATLSSPSASGKSSPDDANTDDEGLDDAPSDPGIHQHLERHGPSGRTLLLDRDGPKLHVQTDWLSIDRN